VVRQSIVETTATSFGRRDVVGRARQRYRIAQEALHNAVEHARASSAQLRLEHGSEGPTPEVSDGGEGLDPQTSFPGYLGLISMRERAARAGGTLQVRSASGEGATVRVRIPAGT
jgi:signal transduction histidine kinase